MLRFWRELSTVGLGSRFRGLRLAFTSFEIKVESFYRFQAYPTASTTVYGSMRQSFLSF